MSYKKKSKKFVNSVSFKSFMKKVTVLLFVVTFFVFTASAFAENVKTKVDPEKWKKLTPEQKEKFKEMMREAQRTGQERDEDYNKVIKELTKWKNNAEDTYTIGKETLKGTASGMTTGAVRGAVICAPLGPVAMKACAAVGATAGGVKGAIKGAATGVAKVATKRVRNKSKNKDKK